MSSSEEKLIDTLLDRGRASLVEYRKLLIMLSVGGVALFFVTLTKKTEPPLTNTESYLLLVSSLLMAMAALFGFVAWKTDSMRYFLYGESLQEKHKDAKHEKYARSKKIEKVTKVSETLLEILFLVGMLVAFSYLLLRTA